MRVRLFHCIALAAVASAPSFGQAPIAVSLTGTLTDSAGTVAIAGATCKLEVLGYTTTTGADGKFTLTGSSAVHMAGSQAPFADFRDGALQLSLPERSEVTITPYSIEGRSFETIQRRMDAGSYALELPEMGTGVRWLKVKAGANETVIKLFAADGALRSSPVAPGESVPRQILAKPAAAALYDWLSCTKAGYQKAYVTISKSDTANIQVKMLKEGATKFSFFVTSMRTLQDLSGPNGFGGDFRFGETGPGSGLRGADKICATIAERSMKGSSVKGWRAFLSVTADAYGKQMNAISRIGQGPWYDRTGRLLAPTLADITKVRPTNGDPTIQLDMPNEWGIPNHQPDPAKPKEDNHHMVTGSTATGTLKGASSTCKDWTTSDGSAANGKPSCGFAWPRGGQVGSSGSNWITTWDAPGCAAGIEIADGGGAPPGSIIIGGGGGYGGFYCFALNP